MYFNLFVFASSTYNVFEISYQQAKIPRLHSYLAFVSIDVHEEYHQLSIICVITLQSVRISRPRYASVFQFRIPFTRIMLKKRKISSRHRAKYNYEYFIDLVLYFTSSKFIMNVVLFVFLQAHLYVYLFGEHCIFINAENLVIITILIYYQRPCIGQCTNKIYHRNPRFLFIFE